jgi:hypothetical protein
VPQIKHLWLNKQVWFQQVSAVANIATSTHSILAGHPEIQFSLLSFIGYALFKLLLCCLHLLAFPHKLFAVGKYSNKLVKLHQS